MSEKVFLLGLILGFAFYSIGINYLFLLLAKRPVPNNLSDLWPAEESERRQKGNTVRANDDKSKEKKGPGPGTKDSQE